MLSIGRFVIANLKDDDNVTPTHIFCSLLNIPKITEFPWMKVQKFKLPIKFPFLIFKLKWKDAEQIQLSTKLIAVFKGYFSSVKKNENEVSFAALETSILQLGPF